MGLKQQAISGAKWTTISTIVTSLIQLLRLAILTRFLDKSDFGIVAILTFVLGLTNTFSDLGFSAVIMHKQDISCKVFSSLYWIQFFAFGGLFFLGALSSPLIATFYKELSIVYLLPIVLFDLVLYGIGKLYDTVLQKDMQFKTIAIRNIVSASLSIVIAFLLAYWGYGVYSMILSTLFNTAMLNIWNFICGQSYYKLQFRMSLKESMPLVKIGLYQTGTQILDYFAAKFDILIIGKLLGAESLGVYNLAKEILMKLILVINSIVNKVALPIFSKVQDDLEGMRSAYCKVIKIVSSINFPISILFGVLSFQIVGILYGPGYEDVSELMSILSIWSLFLCIGNPVGSIAIVTGNTLLSFKYTIVRVVIMIPCVYFASLFCTKTVAWSNVLMAIIMFFVAWYMLLRKILNLSFLQYFNSFAKDLVFSLVLGAVMLVVVRNNLFDLSNNLYIIGLVYGAVIIIIYAVYYIALYRHDFSSIIDCIHPSTKYQEPML